jgi:hypothetical protein
MTATTNVPDRLAPANTAAACIDALAKLAISRAAYAATVVVAAAIFWLAPRLPMTDLPQHAAQVTLWRDMLTGQSAWNDLFRINLLTPYLTTYMLALALSFAVSATTAFKLLLTAAFLGFVASCIQLRRDFEGDERFDWLFIISFFGFAYEWGFVTFLISAPICLQFIRLSHRQVNTTSLTSDIGIVVLGLTLLVSHGLSFIFAGLVAGFMLLQAAGLSRILLRRAVPYALLALACVAFAWVGRDTVAGHPITVTDWHSPTTKLRALAINLQGSYSQTLLPLTLGILAAIWLMRPKLSRVAAIPFAVIMTVYFLAPSYSFSTALIYQRFAIFLLPLFAVACSRKAASAVTLETRVSLIALMLACWIIIATNAKRVYAFGVESADFEIVLNAAEPRRRALSIVKDRTSSAADNPMVYSHHASWYQADKQGLVEFNFAYFHPMVVRYRPGSMLNNGFGFNSDYLTLFDWSLPQTRTADYYFIRQEGTALPPEFATNPACELKLLRTAGLWSLFERGTCKP